MRYSLVLLFSLLLCLQKADAATITMMCSSFGKESSLCRDGVKRWEKTTEHTVQIVNQSASSSHQLAFYQQMMGARAADIDVFPIDIIWLGILGNHLEDLSSYTKGEENKHFPQIVKNNTVAEKLVAMPWFSSVGLMFYRRDLLKKYHQPVPETWEELTRVAQFIQGREVAAGRKKMVGYVFQAKANEGLTCNALEWVYSFGGGKIINADGQVTINNFHALDALKMARGWIGTITPKGILNYMEEDARGIFQSGNAVFMRNWPYAWALAESKDSPVRGNVGVTVMPRGGEYGTSATTLGGWQLGVSKYSQSKQAAAELVMWLTSEQEQKRRAIEGALPPTIVSLYDDPDILKVNPFIGQLRTSFNDAVARPSTVAGENYNKVSSSVFNFVHNVLSGSLSPEESLIKLEKKLKGIKLKRTR